MAPKLYKASEVCDLTQLQSYVLRSWEKEFPGIGVQKSGDSQRLYRQSDIDQVLRIKQLVFTEGLTLSGARRRIESTQPEASSVSDAEVAEVLDALAADARTRVANVREGLRSVLRVLSSAPGTVVLVDDFKLVPLPNAGAKPSRSGAGRSAALQHSAVKRATLKGDRVNGISVQSEPVNGEAANSEAATNGSAGSGPAGGRGKPHIVSTQAVPQPKPKPKAKRASL
jgi:DNA-binding transcriptional MerR regulator